MKKEEALKRLSASRRALLEAISGSSDSDLTGFRVEGIWNTKDLLGHVAAWEQTLCEPLRIFTAGGPFSPEVIQDGEAWNLEQAGRRSAWSIPEVRKELETTRENLLQELKKLSEDQWGQASRAPWGEKNTIAEMISGLAWHEEEHTNSILKFFAK